MNSNARILFFKATQLGLFGVSAPVKGYVNKKTGKPVAPYTGIRHHALQKPDHPLGESVAIAHNAASPAAPEPQPVPLFTGDTQAQPLSLDPNTNHGSNRYLLHGGLLHIYSNPFMRFIGYRLTGADRSISKHIEGAIRPGNNGRLAFHYNLKAATPGVAFIELEPDPATVDYQRGYNDAAARNLRTFPKAVNKQSAAYQDGYSAAIGKITEGEPDRDVADWVKEQRKRLQP